MVALTIDQECHPKPYSQRHLVTWSFSDLAKQGYSETTPCGKLANMDTQRDGLCCFTYSKTTRPRHPRKWLLRNYSYYLANHCVLWTWFSNYSKTNLKLLKNYSVSAQLLENYSKTTLKLLRVLKTTQKLLQNYSVSDVEFQTTPKLFCVWTPVWVWCWDIPKPTPTFSRNSKTTQCQTVLPETTPLFLGTYSYFGGLGEQWSWV